jgi:hypothetical protein
MNSVDQVGFLLDYIQTGTLALELLPDGQIVPLEGYASEEEARLGSLHAPHPARKPPVSVPDTVDQNKPMPLEMAARVAFPDGSMTVSGLRNEIRKGNLEASKVAGRIWTTVNNIERLMQRCSITEAAGDAARDRNSICANRNDPAASSDGSSSTAPPADNESSEALAHLNQIAQRLRKPSRPTLPQSMSPTLGKVVPIKS